MVNPTQPAVKLTLDGEAFSLRFDFEAIANAEEITGRPLLTGLTKRDIGTPTISLVRNMFYACLLPDQPSITLDKAKALVTRKTITTVWASVLEAWTLGMAEPEDEPEVVEADPTQAQS